MLPVKSMAMQSPRPASRSPILAFLLFDPFFMISLIFIPVIALFPGLC